MLRIDAFLLVVTMVSVIYCQGSCPGFSAFSSYTAISGTSTQLTGTYYTEYTSATPFDCERITYSTDQYNVTTGHLEYPDCCLLIDNLDYVSNQLNYDIDPAPSPYSSCSGISSTTGSFKLLDSFGSGSSHCLIFAVCKSDYYGINVMCRGQVPLFADVVAIVINLLGFLTQTQVLEMSTVRQTDCVIPTNNCPAFPA